MKGGFKTRPLVLTLVNSRYKTLCKGCKTHRGMHMIQNSMPEVSSKLLRLHYYKSSQIIWSGRRHKSSQCWKTDPNTCCIISVFCFSLKEEGQEWRKKKTTISVKFKLNYNTGEADNYLETRQSLVCSTWHVCWTVWLSSSIGLFQKKKKKIC